MMRFATADGLSLAANVAGPADAPRVLFLHGGGQTRHSWGGAVERLGEAGFRAVTLDLRGHGDSDWSPAGDYRLDAHAADVRSAIDAMGAPVALVGASLGGLASLLVAGRDRPADVTALVLVDVVPQIEPEGSAEIVDFMTGNLDGFASIDEAADAVAAYLPHRTRPASNAGLEKNLRLRDDGRWYWHWDPRLMTGSDRVHPAAMREILETAARNVAAPTLLVRGALSRVVSPEGVEAFRRLLPSAEVVTVEAADHMVAGDANDRFAAPLLDFLVRPR